MTRPDRITYARSTIFNAWATFCSRSNTPRPSLRARSRTAKKICSTTAGAKPRDGSSSISNFGPAMSKRPRLTMRCWPPERVPANWVERSRRIGKRSYTCSVRWRRFEGSGSFAPPKSKLSSTDKSGNTNRSEGIMAMPARTFLRVP